MFAAQRKHHVMPPLSALRMGVDWHLKMKWDNRAAFLWFLVTLVDMPPLSLHRRAFVKWAAAAPVFVTIASRAIVQRAAAATGAETSIDVYRRIGVRPFINARGTWTYLSGSLELPEVRRAMDAAAHHFVDMFELQHAVGKRLAELSGAESGMVTSGAAGAMAVATAACIAGTDPVKIWQLPDTTGLKHEVIMF